MGAAAIFLDTNIFSMILYERPHYEKYSSDVANKLWVLSFATVAELRYGAAKAGWGVPKRKKLENRISLCAVLNSDDAVSSAWADLNNRFANQIDVNDLWIVATALARTPTLPVVTHDRKLAEVASKSGLTTICRLPPI